MSATIAPLMSTEELLAMPEDGMDRWLLRGQLREKPMTKRNRFLSSVMSRLSQLLGMWLDDQPEPRGDVLCGEAGCCLARDPDTTFGIDVVYIAPELAARQTDETTLIEGVPTLVVEILSPSDTQKEIHEKIAAYLEAGVPLVWIVDPYDHTVRVYCPDVEPELFNVNQEIAADPHLPGFRVQIEKIFRR